MFVVFAGAALLSTFALFSRQSLIISYILLGVSLGPWGFDVIPETHFIEEIGDVGVIFLLFLLGMHLDPLGMMEKISKSAWVALLSSLAFMSLGYGVAMLFDLPFTDRIVLGLSMMFSSTIISLKLLPSGLVYNNPVSEYMISILLIQDLLAMFALLIIPMIGGDGLSIIAFAKPFIALPMVIVISFAVENFILSKLFNVFEKNREYLFLLAIAWCLSVSELCYFMGLSHEIGAFVAGVTLASDSRVSLYLAKALEPLRDFFLVMFFFSVGASYNFGMLESVLWPTITSVVIVLLFKPYAFRLLMVQIGEALDEGWELGSRLGQGSEFSLLLSKVALSAGVLSFEGASIIQGVAVLSFIVSSFMVVRYFATPIASKADVEST